MNKITSKNITIHSDLLATKELIYHPCGFECFQPLHDIVSRNGQGGKRAMRIYPLWDKPTSRQAQKTQDWQLAYFLGGNCK